MWEVVTLAVCGGRHTDADSWSMWRGCAASLSLTGVGQQRDLCREKRSDAYLESWGMSRHIRQGSNSLLMELLWQISCLKSPSCQTQRFPGQMFHRHHLMSGRWWRCRSASPSSFVLGVKRWCFHGWDAYMGNSEFCTSVAKSMELKLMYVGDRCVSQAINWDSLLISSWFSHEITLFSRVHKCWHVFFKLFSILSGEQDIAASHRLVLSLHSSLTCSQNTSFLHIQAQSQPKMPKIKRKAHELDHKQFSVATDVHICPDKPWREHLTYLLNTREFDVLGHMYLCEKVPIAA